MIKLENAQITGWEPAIRGMRNPMNSWEKSDSIFTTPGGEEGHSINGDYKPFPPMHECGVDIGPSDHDLMLRLAKASSVEGKFRRMISVYVDVTAPLYWWSEYDTYKVGTVANSCSKMHKLMAKPFSMGDFSFDHLPGYKKDVKNEIPDFDYEKEEWKISTVNIHYLVSNFGRIKHNGRILGGSFHEDGYIVVTIDKRQYPIHRLVCEAFKENPMNKPEVNHIDGNKWNNSIGNLEWVTRRENQLHACQQCLQPRGLSGYTGKFSKEQREEIVEMWNSGEYTKRQLAKKYDVSRTCIADIISGKYSYEKRINVYETYARPIVDRLNSLRDAWLKETDEAVKKELWYSVIQLLPVSYNQRRTVMLNYEVLSNIYRNRRNHKLDEWREFCQWIETLPYSEIITCNA